MRRTEYLSELIQDVTFACRQLLKNPAFSIVAITTLALGIGATTAIFSAVHAVVLRPLPVPEPERILAIYEDYRGNRGNVSAGNFVDGVVPASSFSDVTAIQYSSFNLATTESTERIVGARTTAGFFRVFGTNAERGRVYSEDEDQPGRDQVVVLSNRVWRGGLASDPSILGRQIRAERPAARSDRHHAGALRLHRAERRALGADRLHGGAQGAARRALSAGLRPVRPGRDGCPGARELQQQRAPAAQGLSTPRSGARLHRRRCDGGAGRRLRPSSLHSPRRRRVAYC